MQYVVILHTPDGDVRKAFGYLMYKAIECWREYMIAGKRATLTVED